MKEIAYVPSTKHEAAAALRFSLGCSIQKLPREDFINVWHAIAYLFPGLHPDGYDEPKSGWPRVLRPFAAEAWSRAIAGELADSELYPFEAAWCAIYDALERTPTSEEKSRRLHTAALHGLPA